MFTGHRLRRLSQVLVAPISSIRIATQFIYIKLRFIVVSEILCAYTGIRSMTGLRPGRPAKSSPHSITVLHAK